MARGAFVCSTSDAARDVLCPCWRVAHAAIIRADPLLRGIYLPIGTAVHERTLPLCTSLNYREWSGFYAVSVYETHHEHEYNAIRNAAAMIDVSPLYKYRLTGRDRSEEHTSELQSRSDLVC